MAKSSPAPDRMWGTPDDPDKPWEAPDGTRWLYFPVFGEWNGWNPLSAEGSDQWVAGMLMTRTIAEFRKSYPGAPRWDNWRQR